MSTRKRIILLLTIAAGLISAFRTIEFQIPQTQGESVSSAFSDSLISEPDGFENTRDESDTSESPRNVIQLSEFVNEIQDGSANEIKGIYSEDQFALHVVDQPSNKPSYVSSIDGVITNFQMPKKYGVIGMIAHNYLAGRHFFTLQAGDIVQVVYGNGEIKEFQIQEVIEYQALSPHSPYSDFRELETGEILTATELFKKVYTGEFHLTLQTCIQVGNMDSWGRIFLIAEPI